MKKVFLVLSDQYCKEPGGSTATYCDSGVVAIFSDREKANDFVEIQPSRNSFGPLYWRVQEYFIDEKVVVSDENL